MDKPKPETRNTQLETLKSSWDHKNTSSNLKPRTLALSLSKGRASNFKSPLTFLNLCRNFTTRNFATHENQMKKHIKNPFEFGKIVGGGQFCNRTHELNEIRSYMLDSYSFWLYSPRRYGKSSLIHKAFAETKGVITIYFDLYNVRSLDDFCKKYAALLAKHLFSWDQEVRDLLKTFTRYFKDLYPKVSFGTDGLPMFSLEKSNITHQLDVETILNIPKQINSGLNAPICIAFDEFQEIKRIDPFLIHWMRSAFQQHPSVSYVFLGSEQSLMEDIFTSSNSPFYEFATKMSLGPISHTDWLDFISENFKSSGFTIHTDILDHMLQISEGHPHFTQFFASVIFDLVRGGLNQSDPEFKELWLNKIIQSQSIIFQTLYDQLTNIQRLILTNIAVLGEEEELFSIKNKERYKLPANSSIVAAINSLIKQSLILKKNHRYHILNPVFKAWLKTI